MILGVDHIALSIEDVSHAAELLKKVGLRARFIQKDVPNDPAKRDFLRSYEPLHSLAYCQSEDSVSVELTQHSRSLHDALSPYQVLINRRINDATPFAGDLTSWGSVWQDSLGCVRPVAALSPSFHAQFWYDESHDEPSSGFIRALLLPVTNLSVSEKFWVNGLGFQAVNHGSIDAGGNWVHISFRAPVQTWSLNLVLAEDNQTKASPYLDDPGFPCLALISNRLNNDIESSLKMGARGASDEFCLVIGEKPLQIVLLRGPDNELVELIGFSPG